MFYSQLLLSKKGALGIIWMAAHCHKRLKKNQVQQTDIPSSVDKIMDDEVPVVTHRILAFLLLGIVRIYSKKVEYLFDDCHEILNRLCSVKTRKTARAGIGVSNSQRHYHSITLPKRFELDTFDLGLGLDRDAMGWNVRSREQETRADGRKKDYRRCGSICKAIVPISCTPPRDVFEAYQEQDLLVKPSSNATISLAGVEELRRTRRSLEDCIDLVQLDETENEQMHNKLPNRDWRNCPINEADSDSDSAVRLSNTNRHPSLPSSGLELMVLDEAENEQLNNRPSHDKANPNFRGRIQEEQMHDNLSDNDLRINIQGSTNNMESDFVLRLSNNAILSLPSLEMLRGTVFTLEDRLEPMVLDEAEKEQLYVRPSNKITSSNFLGPIQDVELNSVMNQSHEGTDPVENLEMLHEGNFSLEHLSTFNLLKSAEKRDGHDKPTHEEHEVEEKHMDHLLTQTRSSFQEGLDQVFSEAVDNAGKVGPELEVIPLESVKCQKPENVHVSIQNPHSKLPADVGPMEVAAIQTPGRKERAMILKKRKALVDVATVVPNKILKSWIEEDPIDLKRQRKEIPRTRLQAWRTHKHCHAPSSFLEPSIPGVSVNLCYNGCWESSAPETISAEPSVGQDGLQASTGHGAQEHIQEDIRYPITEESPRQTPVVSSPLADKPSGQISDVTSLVLEKPSGQAPAVRSPVAENCPDQIPIAPGTPVAYLNSLRSHEAETVADSDILEPSSSLESIETTFSNKQLGLDYLLQEETSSYKGDSLEKDAFTARTRIIGSYLGRKILHKKIRTDEEVLSLSRLLAGKTKKESTIMFYEILVLKTRDCIDVQQESAYRDILVRETPKLRQYFE
ncbi:sister chromatid cohesion 1 protein 2-like isoform X2 [Salvia miltiorrhiza]|uniref:sister chromatid cohesion 1 protein 2-like isoform X2 n=1 Tax=Salvia miltiorrhiza TaxID=226208 RepID=UPI0025ABF4D0|nr:sister chromatid cohesion 1 protein 2-like isoform X2 [Salvia miltiorrhiza]